MARMKPVTPVPENSQLTRRSRREENTIREPERAQPTKARPAKKEPSKLSDVAKATQLRRLSQQDKELAALAGVTAKDRKALAKAPFKNAVPAQPKSVETEKPAKKSKLKIPKKLGACADMLYNLRENRLQMQKQVDALAEQESELREHILNNLPKSEAHGIAGATARVTRVEKDIPRVTDWDAFYTYVKKTGSFDLMQRRLNDAAVKERWNAKKRVNIPGVGEFKAITLSVTKA